MLSGCALFFPEGDKLIGVIPSDTGSDVRFRTVLPRRATAIKFHCEAPTSSLRGEDKVIIALTNISTDRTIMVGKVGAWATIAPHNGALLYEGTLTNLLGGEWLRISTWSGRASCELHVRFSPAPTLPKPIRVTCHYSSPPL